MVICLSCSSARESMYRTLPAILLDMMPFEDTKKSERVVLPEHTLGTITKPARVLCRTMVDVRENADVAHSRHVVLQ